jgi:hypothetical protein
MQDEGWYGEVTVPPMVYDKGSAPCSDQQHRQDNQ